MRTCARCGTEFPDDARFCPEDGVQLFSSRDDPYIGQVFLKQFEVREICGRGSMGTVYRAWQTNMEREVAVKVLRRDLLRDERVVKRFHREARASARLSHPNIIIVYMVGDTDDGVPCLVMEYVKGVSLDETCRQAGPLPTVRALHVAKQIAAALAEAHSQSIVHRDLKPENIILSNKKHTPDFVKVLDFGIAKILYAKDESLLTQTGAIFGTPHYLAPEQASGADIDHRCDLYALGVILFRMVTGRLPFQSASGMEVLIQHIKQAPPRPREILETVPRPLEALILKALEKDQAKRFQSAEELGQALDQVLTQLRTGVLPAVSQEEVAEASTADDSDEDATAKAPMDVGTGKQSFSATQMGTPGPDTPTLREDEAPQAPKEGVPLDPSATGGDPRFHVPANRELDAPVRPTVDQGVASSTQQPTVEQRPLTSAHGTIDDGHVTMGLSNSIMGRRRSLFYVVLALVSILGGGAVGALIYTVETAGASDLPPELRESVGDPAEDPAAGNLSPADPALAAAPSQPDARPDPAVTKTKTRTKPVTKRRQPRKTSTRKTSTRKKVRRPRIKRARIPVLGPPPTVDSHGSSTPPAHGHTPPTKKAEPKTNDNLYDLVD
jgi:serine/threonine protein kinase